MRNYIIFYAAIIVFVIGGIKWTSYVIEKEKQEELDKINFHKNVTDLLSSGGDILPAETSNKNIVIYTLGLYSDSTQTNYLKLNDLTKKYPNTVFYLFSRSADKEYTEKFFKKIKVEPAFKIIYKPREFTNYIQSLTHYFYTKEELEKITIRIVVPATMVISNTGKIKLYKLGTEKDIMEQVEAVIGPN